jgi:hypothetical protein
MNVSFAAVVSAAVAEATTASSQRPNQVQVRVRFVPVKYRLLWISLQTPSAVIMRATVRQVSKIGNPNRPAALQEMMRPNHFSASQNMVGRNAEDG